MQDATPALPNSIAQRDRLQRISAHGAFGRLGHCVTTAVELRGPIDEPLLQARLEDLVRRRPALGSVFEGIDVHRPMRGRLELHRHMVTGPDPERRWRDARAIADAEAQRPFAAGEHPLIRALLLSTGDHRHLLVLTVDQLVGDAWSSNLLVEDLLGGAGDAPDAYPAVWAQRVAWLAGPAGQAAVARRRTHLGDAALSWPLPVNQEDGPALPLTDRFATLADPVADALRRQVRAARATMLAAAMTAAATLSSDPGLPLALRTTLAGRESSEEQDVVGWFATEGVVRLPPRTSTVAAYVAAMRSEIFAALTDQRIPYACLADGLAPGEPGGPSVAVVYLPAALTGGMDDERGIGDAVAGRAGVSICPTGADIDFFLLEDAPPMSTTPRALLTTGAMAHPGTVGTETVEHLLARFTAALTALAGVPWDSTPIGDLAADVTVAAPGRARP